MKNDKLLSVLVLLLSLTASMMAFAQESHKQSCSVPLVVNHFNQQTRHLEHVQDLGVKDLSVRVGGKVVTPESVAVDSSPKRVVIVLDASKEIPEPEWKMAMEVAIHLVRRARADDRFALVITGDTGSGGEWMSGAQASERFAKQASAGPPLGKRRERNYDALMSAVKLLNTAQFGDVVLFFGHPEDSGSDATPEKVQEAFLKNGLRFYGISFTERPTWIKVGSNLYEMLELGRRTGGVFWSAPRSLSTSELSPVFKERALELYTGIAEPYRLTLSVPSAKKKTKFEIEVTDAKKRKLEPEDVYHPYFVYPCDK